MNKLSGKEKGEVVRGRIKSVVDVSELDKLPATPLRGVRYQLSSNDGVFNSTIPRNVFEKWMTMLESVLTYHLYGGEGFVKPTISFYRIEVTNFNGVAYTLSSGSGKLTRISSQYLAKIAPANRYAEISGVVLHEMVHALQYNGGGACPWYYIEGTADYIRMRGGVPNKGWVRTFGSYRNGYSECAYFFDWLDRTYPAFVKQFNDKMRRPYTDGAIVEITGKSVDVLWGEYKAAYGK